MRQPFTPWPLAGLAAVALGCIGSIGARDGAGTEAPGATAPGTPGRPGLTPDPGSGPPALGQPTTPGAPAGPGGPAAGTAPLRRLTAEQYRNTVRDLLGIPDAVAVTALPPDESIAEKFTSNVLRPLQGADLDRYADVAGQIARRATSRLADLVPCAPTAGDAACATRFIESFGRRAYRRPLEPPEVQRLQQVHAAGRTFDNGIRLVVEALLQSPKFLYLVEPAGSEIGGQIVPLDGWSLATRLSYFLWNSTPDVPLLDAVAKGQLTSPADVADQARRLMADGRFQDTVALFHQAWLDLGELAGAEKSAELFPLWNESLKATMAEETRRFVEHVLKDGDGKLASLLSAKFSFLSGPLYDIYGLPRPAGAAASAWQRVELPADQRAGLLTQPGLMSALAREDRTSYVRRGKMVREALFCQSVPPPPPGVNDTEGDVPATATAQERAAAHRDKPDCAACHQLFDPIGFAFETYDAIGRFRTSDGGGPIESQLSLTGTSIDGTYGSALELATRLGEAEDLRACLARQWLRFALGREETDADGPSLSAAVAATSSSGGHIPELIFTLVRSDSFRYQQVQ
jgi:hypothetical protein